MFKSNTNPTLILLLSALFLSFQSLAQRDFETYENGFFIKTDLVNWAYVNANLIGEYRIDEKTRTYLGVNYSFSDNDSRIENRFGLFLNDQYDQSYGAILGGNISFLEIINSHFYAGGDVNYQKLTYLDEQADLFRFDLGVGIRAYPITKVEVDFRIGANIATYYDYYDRIGNQQINEGFQIGENMVTTIDLTIGYRIWEN